MFNNYWNFAGTSLPSGWILSGSSGGVVDNSWSISGSTSGGGGIITVNTFGVSVLDWYGYATVPTGAGYWINLGYVNSSKGTGNNWFTYQGQNDYGYGYVTNSGSTQTVTYTSTAAGSLPNYIFSVANNGVTGYYLLNYNQQSTTYPMLTAINNIVFRNGASSSGGGANVFVQWLRTRAYPPNGTMPSVTYG